MHAHKIVFLISVFLTFSFAYAIADCHMELTLTTTQTLNASNNLVITNIDLNTAKQIDGEYRITNNYGNTDNVIMFLANDQSVIQQYGLDLDPIPTDANYTELIETIKSFPNQTITAEFTIEVPYNAAIKSIQLSIAGLPDNNIPLDESSLPACTKSTLNAGAGGRIGSDQYCDEDLFPIAQDENNFICSACGDGTCSAFENEDTCPLDCTPAEVVCITGYVPSNGECVWENAPHLCGNQIVEPSNDEECDAGPEGSVTCTKTCKIILQSTIDANLTVSGSDFLDAYYKGATAMAQAISIGASKLTCAAGTSPKATLGNVNYNILDYNAAVTILQIQYQYQLDCVAQCVGEWSCSNWEDTAMGYFVRTCNQTNASTCLNPTNMPITYQQQNNCFDSDALSGTNDKFIQGQTTGFGDEEGFSTSTDFCDDALSLREYSCQNNVRTSQLITCPIGNCDNGVCEAPLPDFNLELNADEIICGIRRGTYNFYTDPFSGLGTLIARTNTTITNCDLNILDSELDSPETYLTIRVDENGTYLVIDSDSVFYNSQNIAHPRYSLTCYGTRGDKGTITGTFNCSD